MFEAKRMLFLYVETPLHAGTGRSLGTVDLPIQRERTTQYPLVQASGLKGCLRVAAGKALNNKATIKELFGPETTDNPSEHAGALAFGDARLLLFPVRSLNGVMAWTTSAEALGRFVRLAEVAGLTRSWGVPPAPGKNEARLSRSKKLIAGEVVVLEEFSFKPLQPSDGEPDVVQAIGQWLAENALPEKKTDAQGQPVADEYNYWREQLPDKLCILPDEAFRDFALYSTEVQTHIKLNPDTKTVDAEAGALWTSESLPADTVLYGPVMATQSRVPGSNKKAGDILDELVNLKLRRVQLGGDETTGQGLVALRLKGA